MSFFGKGKSTQATKALGIEFQSAQYGPPITVLYGKNKVAGNCDWYGDFVATPHTTKSGKGGGGKGATNTSYTYSASFQLVLCEGTIGGVGNIYNGSSVITLASTGGVVANGTVGQAPWAHLTGTAALGYSKTALFSVQNLNLGGSPSLPNYNFEILGLMQYGGGIVDANPKDILNDICTDPDHGINFNFLGSLTQYSNYCVANSLFMSPVYDQQTTAANALGDLFKFTNADAYFSENQLKVVPRGDVAVTGNSVTYTPNNTPIVGLGGNDFLAGTGESPIKISRKAPQDAMNIVRLQYTDRASGYHTSAVTTMIDNDTIATGARSDTSETCDMCCVGSTARFIAQNLLQQTYYIRNTYEFRLSWRYCYLEPCDIVTITDTNTGLSLWPVKITEVAEDAQGTLTITAEEFPAGIGHSAVYANQAYAGTSVDPQADPGAITTPQIFRGPGFLTNPGQPEIWMGLTSPNALWGAADIYLSYDGTTYNYYGTATNKARYGVLGTSLLTNVADPDVTHTPQVNLNAPATMLGGTHADADNFATACLVDNEIIAYSGVTLVSGNNYTLSGNYIRRGGYGSGVATHSIGAPIVCLDGMLYHMPVDPSLIGATIWLKFLSRNVFGNTPRSLASETAYTYVVGTNNNLPDVPATPSTVTIAPVADGVTIAWVCPNPASVGCTSIEFSTSFGGTYTVLAQVGPTTTNFTHHFTSGNTYYYRLRARGVLVQSGWSSYTSVISSTGKIYIPQDGSNLCLNPGFEYNNIGTTLNTNIAVGSPISDGWKVTQRDSTYKVRISNVSGDYNGGAEALEMEVGNGDVIPTGSSAINVQSAAPFPVNAGSVIQVGGMAQWNADFTSAGLTGTMAISVAFLTAAGGSTGSPVTWSTATAPGGYSQQFVNGSVPAGAAQAVVNLSFTMNNTSGSPITTTGGHYLGVPDFDDIIVYQQVGSQQNLPPLTIGSITSRWDSSLAITSTFSAATPSIVTIHVTASNLQVGNTSVPYRSSSGTVSQARSSTVTYQLYYLDPTYAGGSQTLYTTTDPNVLAQSNNNIWIGSIAVTVAATGSGSGGSGDPGGGCVCLDQFLPNGLQAWQVQEGTVIGVCDEYDEATYQRPVKGAEWSLQPCVRIKTVSGAWVDASVSTPMELRNGESVAITEILGKEALVLRNAIADWELVVSCEELGLRAVNHIHVGGRRYWAGGNREAYILTHNPLKP